MYPSSQTSRRHFLQSAGTAVAAASVVGAAAPLHAAAAGMLKALDKAVERLGGLERRIATEDLETYIAERRDAQAVLAQARSQEAASWRV